MPQQEFIKFKVSRVAAGLKVDVEAKEFCRFLHDHLRSRGSYTDASGTTALWLRPVSCNDIRLAQVLTRNHSEKIRDADYGWVNLCFFRDTRGAEGPISHTFAGLFSREEADAYLKEAVKFLKTFYAEYIVPFEKSVTLNIKVEMEDTVAPRTVEEQPAVVAAARRNVREVGTAVAALERELGPTADQLAQELPAEQHEAGF